MILHLNSCNCILCMKKPRTYTKNDLKLIEQLKKQFDKKKVDDFFWG